MFPSPHDMEKIEPSEVERLRSGILDKCMEVGEVVIQLHPRGPGAMDAPKSGGGWWGGGGGAMKSG